MLISLIFMAHGTPYRPGGATGHFQVFPSGTSSSYGAKGRTRFEDGKPVRPKKRRIPKKVAEELYGPPPVVAKTPPIPVKPPKRPSTFVAAAPPPPLVVEPEAPTAREVLDTPNYLAIWREKKRQEEMDDEEVINSTIQALLDSL